MFTVKFFLLAATALTAIHNVDAGAQRWMDSPENRLRAEEKYPRAPKEFVVNLDLPQEERWKEIGEKYADKSFLLVEYLRRNLPRGWLKPIEKIAGKLLPFFRDYGDEMKGYAAALNITDGDVVSINLIYQLERLGLSCDSWNNTGPSMACLLPRNNDDETDEEPDFGNFMPFESEEEEYEREIAEIDSPGPCTSFVISDPESKIWAGRNLDWNFPDVLKEFIINVDYQRGGKTVFKATTAVGFVGILHAVKPGKFGWSMDARRKGGRIGPNLLEMALVRGDRTPEQHARWVFENEDNYADALTALGGTPIVNPVYYILSGVTKPEGAVLARDRKGVVHTYLMEEEIESPGGNVQKDFWVGITNYDLEYHPLPADDRATPMTDNLNALEGKQFGSDEVWNVLKTWPTFNSHTDITAVVDVASGDFDVVIWFDHKNWPTDDDK
mmetsp:Transcript_11617/g.25399  ORF Transcript_11617/g.25399 Transcript_11617/m.25399 type:complete len:442 (+) Transcript_11617:39-1364(+)|eukprot:CAMPEP_0116934480 /NCGR_PEP_ID=MMETSP0467-20121206/29674_1 /TAXON_ID=283647 /ORGANISM="Mesodinium pulex, Strain SPMC105" /LENGTH=441 /DNA_ID=CAMNT_0004615593 /DNA_START=36 /DNA_END=1361 /DNA_ORIENTATION=+